ncbi:uncharacterized protein LOC117120821 [Anneissia japonica]|uniref:uncharacterized protein LOC117120821 n=1 Tax=Anneissia japonica TaxID=1529436 RepID=UPI001425832C|nr:uncharacterized protein LOC117120821 [Anneissia japonica]XP_033121801.1 uncharacterized protein LOC117120821 [Anneissia japonica]XP_033121809.1 uncharacterized protein LOC117120821 [Anneissia japonica]XP_033121817.1 uncharacterized protein LOC117120821 [Anneissia japonica]XP_033121823.1 uncharacterized protein LOC117120821 [Anneissia japonica]
MKETPLLILVIMMYSGFFISCALSRPHNPNPQVSMYGCGRGGKKSLICDPDLVISVQDANLIDKKLHEIQDSFECECDRKNDTCRGYTISIYLTKTIPKYYYGNTPTAEDYANRLRKDWDFGECGEDIVIVGVKDTQQRATSVGKIAARKITEEVISDVYQKTIDRFSESYKDGLLAMLNRYEQALSDGYSLAVIIPVWTIVQMLGGALFVLCCFCSMYVCKRIYS